MGLAFLGAKSRAQSIHSESCKLARCSVQVNQPALAAQRHPGGLVGPGEPQSPSEQTVGAVRPRLLRLTEGPRGDDQGRPKVRGSFRSCEHLECQARGRPIPVIRGGSHLRAPYRAAGSARGRHWVGVLLSPMALGNWPAAVPICWQMQERECSI